MNEIRETISNYSCEPSSEYCRHMVRKKLFGEKSTKEEFNDLGSARSLQAASSYVDIEQNITDALCVNLYIPEEEFKIFDTIAYEKSQIALANLRSSKEYSPTRTSPIVNKLNEIWVISAAGFRDLVNINQVHRNFFYDINSSDQVEDYLLSIQDAEGIHQTSFPRPPPEVRPFCTKEGILNYVPVATEIIDRSFHQIDKIRMAVEEDPETGEKWLLIAITVYGEVGEVLEQYEQYTEQWVAAAPWPERDKIRLSFNII